jgi:hypothetical protein
MDHDRFTLYKRVDAGDLITALDDLDLILKMQCPTPEQRHEALAYVIYRGLTAIREEYALALAEELRAAEGSDHETRQ